MASRIRGWVCVWWECLHANGLARLAGYVTAASAPAPRRRPARRQQAASASAEARRRNRQPRPAFASYHEDRGNNPQVTFNGQRTFAGRGFELRSDNFGHICLIALFFTISPNFQYLIENIESILLMFCIYLYHMKFHLILSAGLVLLLLISCLDMSETGRKINLSKIIFYLSMWIQKFTIT